MAEPISRRGLLQLSYRTAAALGISSMASAQDVRAASDSDSREQSASPTAALGPGLQLHYREDWLGAPWVNPEAALLIHGNLESGEVWFGWVPGMARHDRAALHRKLRKRRALSRNHLARNPFIQFFHFHRFPR